MAVLGKAFKASCVDVLLPRELATGQHLLGQLRLRLQLRHVLDLHVRIVNRVGMHRQRLREAAVDVPTRNSVCDTV